jgi:hypothetical protein
MNNLHKQVNLGYRQRGMSGIGIILILMIIALIALSAVRIVPIYLENMTVRSVLEAVQNDQRIDAKSKSAIWKSVQKRLYINEVRIISKEDVSITRENGQTIVAIEYESRRPYLGSLFIGGSFKESVVIDR